jgi:hypothetical protein
MTFPQEFLVGSGEDGRFFAGEFVGWGAT